MTDFTQFDRSLEDFRENLAASNTTVRKSIKRLVTMLTMLDGAFLLYYDDITDDERKQLREAFDKLASTVECVEATLPKQKRKPTLVQG